MFTQWQTIVLRGRLLFKRSKCIITNTQMLHDVKIKENMETIQWDKAKPYNKIPGPRSYPVFGNALEYIFGKYKGKTMAEMMKLMLDEYGNVAKLTGFAGRDDFVFVFHPDDIELVYRNEGIYPWRRALESFKYYRRYIRPDVHGDIVGVGTAQGPEWHRMRKISNPVMMQPKVLQHYVVPVEEVADELIARMLRIREPNDEMPDNFLNDLNKWALESICRVAIDTRLGCLKDNLEADSDPQRLITSVYCFFDLIYQLEVLPSPWKYISTPAYRKLMKAFDVMTDIALKNVDEAIKRMKENSKPEQENVLQKLIQIDKKVAIVMAMDMILAAVDTTSSATATLLYYLANHQSAQNKLREEIKSILPTKDSKLPQKFMESIPYLRSCMKESLRISPTIQRIVRKTPKDLVLSGYQIPKGTDLVLAHPILQLSETQFTKPKEFIPERWLSVQELGCPVDIPNVREAHAFSFMPFGFGPRMCIGRRFAELEMATLVMKLFRNYRFEWHHGELKYKTTVLNRPVGPLKFKMTAV